MLAGRDEAIADWRENAQVRRSGLHTLLAAEEQHRNLKQS
jgi:hypothetical protein